MEAANGEREEQGRAPGDELPPPVMLGRRHGAEGLLRYTEPQTVAQQRLVPMAPAFGLDDRRYAAVITRSLKALKTLRFR